MSPTNPRGEIRVCGTADLPEGGTRKFRIECRGKEVDGFVLHVGGKFHAYVNSCAHEGSPLDKLAPAFLTPDRRNIVCSNHGAIYDPHTGKCLAGPCREKSLDRLRLRVEKDEIYVACPSDAPGPPERE